MTVRLIGTLMLLGAGLSLATGCVGFGDNSSEVRFHNATDVALNVYESDGQANGRSKFVESGKTVTNQWVIPPVYSGKIEGLHGRFRRARPPANLSSVIGLATTSCND
jgi:hypothetical protein